MVRSGFRGLALGALAVTLVCGAYAAQGLHTGLRVVDWLIGDLLVAGPLLALFVLLRVAAAIAGWVVRRLAGRLTEPWDRRVTATLPAFRFVGHPGVATTLGIAILVWGTPADGPLSMFHAFFFFEIPITAGAIVGFLAGLAWAAPRLPVPTARRRAVAVAAIVPALVLGGGVGAWALTPGPGSPLVREDPAAVGRIPQLGLPDPSQPGPYRVVAGSYGSGSDARRPEFGAAAGWRTPTVDASKALPPRDGIDEPYARWFWGFDSASLPLNALIWYPADAPGRLPVVLIVHGNHDAGDYSDPGYAYLGEHLASRGIIAASIDQNYLNGDAFFDYAGAEMGVRAWLLLRHLAEFRTWDGTAGHPLAGRIDLDRVALIGHSRGGEAAVVAALLEMDPERTIAGLPDAPRGFGIRAVIGIAPSDGMYQGLSSRTRLTNLDYLVIQGAHDGDLPGFSGLGTYHRVAFDEPGHLKVAVFSQRANHGRFNSVWDFGDAGSLDSWMLDRGSMLSIPEQQDLAKGVFGAFLARSLEGETGYDAFFRDPRAGRAWLPDDVVETHWQTSERVQVEDFAEGRVDRDRNEAVGFASVTGIDPPLRDGTFQRDRAASLTWTGPAAYTVAIDGDVRGRIGSDGALVFSAGAAGDGTTVVDPVVELRTSDGRTASIRLADAVPGRPSLPTRLWKLDGLGDRYLPSEKRLSPAERFLQTYAIDLKAFALDGETPGVDPSRIRSVTFRFDGAGALFLDDIGFEPGAARLAD